LTGAKIALHYREKGWLESPGGPPLPTPPGVTAWGRILVKMSRLFMHQVEIRPTEVEVVLGDEGLALTDYGIAGRVLYTPGHSSGSVSVLLDTGDAFVGDLAMNRFPLRLGPGLPILAEDMPSVKASWIHLLDEGAETVYPAHGKPFPAEIMRRALS
jgi:glyoxylase-like metal-dependent hydrolase (beta-lactamase superfamily II)